MTFGEQAFLRGGPSASCASALPSRGAWTPDAIRRGMRLYAVTDSSWLGGRTLAECVRQAIAGGATFVQLREKHLCTDEIVALAATILPVCREAGVSFVIDDDVEAALRSGADGVHRGSPMRHAPMRGVF